MIVPKVTKSPNDWDIIAGALAEWGAIKLNRSQELKEPFFNYALPVLDRLRAKHDNLNDYK